MSRPIVLGAASLAILAATGTAAGAETRCEIDFGMIVQHLKSKTQTSPVHQGPVGPSTHFGSHGQLVFGEDEVYLHHLPFLLANPGRHPHNFQVLMRVSFVDEADQQAYLERRKLLPDALFTALPGPFNQDAIEEIFESGAAGQELGPVELYDEHFENSPPPQPFLTAPMIVDEVVQFTELLPDGPPAEELRYLIVDGGHEAFLVHELSSPPDFDQVLKVSLSYENSGRFEDSFDGGVLRIVGAGNREDERLSAGDTQICSAHDGTRRMPFDVPVTIERETYCEAGELSAVASSPSFEGKRACRG